MTLMEETDIYKQIQWLLNNPDYSFSSIHWQLDAGFWKNDFYKRNFAKWIENNTEKQRQKEPVKKKKGKFLFPGRSIIAID